MKKRHIKRKVKTFFITVGIIILIVIIYNQWNNFNDYYLNNEMIDQSNNNDLSSNINYDELTILERLEKLSTQDNRINSIIDHYDDYPEELLDMLSRNIEMIDFVVDYPEKQGQVYSDNVGKITKGTIPLLLQWDKRWGYAYYGKSSIAISGCGPTALSMVIVGLTGDNTITPYEVATFSERNGYYLAGSGTSWSLMTEGANHYGVMAKEISLSKNRIFEALEKGHPIICSVKEGDFTTTGHFIVLVSIKNGKIEVHDPNSISRSEVLWDYERLEYQIKNLWEFSY